MKGNIMAIGPVSSGANTASLVQTQNQVVRPREAENDKDKDDGAAKAAAQNATQAAPSPTVNTSGQVVGSVVNTQA